MSETEWLLKTLSICVPTLNPNISSVKLLPQVSGHDEYRYFFPNPSAKQDAITDTDMQNANTQIRTYEIKKSI